MTANREQQHERLKALYREWEGTSVRSMYSLIDHFLDNGVTVEVPEQPDPDPWPVPGSVAIATVRGVEGLQVWADRSPVDDGLIWHTAEVVGGWTVHRADQVTVTSRAAVVTEADRDEFFSNWDDQWPDAAYEYVARMFAARLGGGR